MLVVAYHNISDPGGFWVAAEKVSKNLPGSMKLYFIYPAADGNEFSQNL